MQDQLLAAIEKRGFELIVGESQLTTKGLIKTLCGDEPAAVTVSFNADGITTLTDRLDLNAKSMDEEPGIADTDTKKGNNSQKSLLFILSMFLCRLALQLPL